MSVSKPENLEQLEAEACHLATICVALNICAHWHEHNKPIQRVSLGKRELRRILQHVAGETPDETSPEVDAVQTVLAYQPPRAWAQLEPGWASDPVVEGLRTRIAAHVEAAYLQELARAVSLHLQGVDISEKAARVARFQDLPPQAADRIAEQLRPVWMHAKHWDELDVEQISVHFGGSVEETRNALKDLRVFTRWVLEPFHTRSLDAEFFNKNLDYVIPKWFDLHMRNRGAHVLDAGAADAWDALHGWELSGVVRVGS